MKKFCLKHLMLLSFLCSLFLGTVVCFIQTGRSEDFPADVLLLGMLEGIFLIHPLILTLCNLVSLFLRPDDPQTAYSCWLCEILTLMCGFFYSGLLLAFSDITFSDWPVILHNSQVHTPVWTEGIVSVVLLALIGVAGFTVLNLVSLSKMPPLLSVLSISAMYLGMLECVLWILQVFSPDPLRFYLCLFPFNCILIGIRSIRLKMVEWRKLQPVETAHLTNRTLERLNQKLLDSGRWPGAAFLLAWPLLGIALCVLILLFQRPDSIIRAWTETSDWNLSTKISPQNVLYDEHYLCTAAAGGHPRIVKPLRMGVRHGHRVVVNRQLCIANAFEQLLEEHTPRFHRRVRSFYDRYGFPVARLIRSPFAADAVYLLMKPLEWLFLIVLYLVDVKPENRIAVQYLPKMPENFTPKQIGIDIFKRIDNLPPPSYNLYITTLVRITIPVMRNRNLYTEELFMAALPQISEAEYEVIKIVWKHAPISTNEITDRLLKTTSWSPKTIQTLIKRLVTKGVLSYEKEGRVFVYTPLVAENDYIGQESRSFLNRFYGGDLSSMVSSYIKNDRLSESEIETLRALLSGEQKD